jgi:hypothetical protein
MLNLAAANMMSLTSNATQRLLSQANNISYAVRDSYRMGTVPENRKADYMFRHFYMVPVCAILTELGFRIAEGLYTMPQMTRVLGLKTLGETYGKDSKSSVANGVAKDVVGQFKHLNPEDIPRYNSLQEIPFLKSRLTGSLARESSTVLIPGLVKDVDMAALSPEAQKQHEVLVHHLKRLMSFDSEKGFLDELVASQKITADESSLIKKGMGELHKILDVAERLGRKMPQYVENAVHQLKPKDAELVKTAFESLEKHAPELAQSLEALKPALANVTQGATLAGKDLKLIHEGVQALQAGSFIERFAGQASETVKGLIGEGALNKLKVLELKAIQKTSFWPKMLVTTALNFVLYGVLQSWLDVNVIQPWQKKLFAKRGTTNEVVAPVYWGLIPFGVTLWGLMNDKITPKFIQKMGHIGRFAFAGTAALGAYTGTAIGLTAYRLSKPPQKPVSDTQFGQSGMMSQANPALMGPLVSGPPLRHPRGFQGFERALRQA